MTLVNVKFVFIVITIVITIIILANLELYMNKRNCIFSVSLSKDSSVFLPEYTGFMDPVYVYNSKKIKKRDLNYQVGYNEGKYIKKNIQEHVASKISNPLKELGSLLKKIPKSKTPINTLYSTFGKSGEIINTADPLSYNPLSGYKMLTSIRDGADAFIANDKLYVIKNN